MSFKDLSIEEYNHALGEKKSTPGGGSALAITLSLACSLLLMVINFTLDKKGYEEHQKRMVELKENITRIQEEAFVLADEDSLTFKALMASYKYQFIIYLNIKFYLLYCFNNLIGHLST